MEVRQQQVDAEGDPELAEDGIGRSPEEALDLEVLLDPLEEELDLPAFLVELGDGGSGQVCGVGEEDVVPAGLRIPVADPAQNQPIGEGLPALEPDRLIRGETGAWADLATIENGVGDVSLEPGDKPYLLLIQSMEQLVVIEPAVEDHDASRWKLEGPSPMDFVLLALGDRQEGGEVPVVIQTDMDLDRPFRRLVLGPREQRCGELDQRGVQREELALEPEPMTGRMPLGPSQQLVEDLLEQRGRLIAVDPGQRRAGDRPSSEVIQLPDLGLEVRHQIPQAGPTGQMRHGQGKELIPPTHRTQIPAPMVPNGGCLEFMSRKYFEELGKNGRIMSQGLVPPFVVNGLVCNLHCSKGLGNQAFFSPVCGTAVPYA